MLELQRFDSKHGSYDEVSCLVFNEHWWSPKGKMTCDLVHVGHPTETKERQRSTLAHVELATELRYELICTFSSVGRATDS